MRLVRLLVVATLVLVAGRMAAGQDSKPNNSPGSSRHNNVRPIAPVKDLGPEANPVSPQQNWLAPVYGESRCFTMHTIRVVREDGTDATHAVGESTCTPMARLQIKSTVSNPAVQK